MREAMRLDKFLATRPSLMGSGSVNYADSCVAVFRRYHDRRRSPLNLLPKLKKPFDPRLVDELAPK